MRTLLKYRESSLYHSVSKDKHPRKYHSGEAKCLKSFIQPAYVAVLSGERDNVLVTEPLTERERESLQENGEEAFEVPRGFASRSSRLGRQDFIPRPYNTASYAGYCLLHCLSWLCLNATTISISSQGQSAREYWLKRGLSALERYFFLILFNAYLHEQVRKRSIK